MTGGLVFEEHTSGPFPNVVLGYVDKDVVIYPA